MITSGARNNWQIVITAVSVALVVSVASAAEKKLPTWDVVEQLVVGQLTANATYRDGDLLSQSQVAPIFAQLEAHGWLVADRANILANVLPDNDYLVEQLRTPEGVKFMRKIATYPQAYDEIDQLSQLPSGELMVKDFLRFAHSDRSFSNKKGPSPAMYARLVPDQKRRGVPTSADLEKPTGRVYTAAQLCARLQQSYRVALSSAAQP